MSFPKYPEYKDSGVEWLGEVPAHWEVVKLGYLAISQGGGTPPKDELQYWNGSIPWVTPKDMKQQWITYTIDTLSEAALQASPVSMIEPEHVLIVFRSGILRHRIPVAINKVPVTVNQDLRAYNVKPRLLPAFFLRLTQGLNRELLPEWSKQGATVESLDSELVSSTQLPVPSRTEQKAITFFLDHETARIDALVEEQQRLIELLKEKRQAVISHAVTKGLDPDVPMKDSGVEWLGEVPAHWDVVPIGYRYEIQLGRMLNETRSSGENLKPYLRVFDVQWGFINTQNLPLMDFPPSAQKAYRLEPGDLMVNEGGSYVGRSAIWRGELSECYYQKALHRLRPRLHPSDTADFFLYVMEMATQKGVFVANANQTTIDHLTAEQLRRHRFAFPPLVEQKEIARYLEEATIKLERLTEEAQGLITLLQERRSALISAAVTGKIDVRGWQAGRESDQSEMLMAAEERATYG